MALRSLLSRHRYSNLLSYPVFEFSSHTQIRVHTHTHIYACARECTHPDRVQAACYTIKKVNNDVILLSSHLPSRANVSFSFLSRISLTFSYHRTPIVLWRSLRDLRINCTTQSRKLSFARTCLALVDFRIIFFLCLSKISLTFDSSVSMFPKI